MEWTIAFPSYLMAGPLPSQQTFTGPGVRPSSWLILWPTLAILARALVSQAPGIV
jgi:hypothetical protein